MRCRKSRFAIGGTFLLLLAGCGGGGGSRAAVPIASAIAQVGQDTVATATSAPWVGVRVRIPAGAVPPGTTVQVFSARPDPAGFTPAGSGIRVEVSAGLAPGAFADVTLPYDTTVVGGAGAAVTDLLILAERGGATDLYPYPRTFPTAGTTVTARVTGFSTLVPVLADGPDSFPAPTPPTLRGAPVVAVASHGIAIGPEGTVFTWGSNGAGQLGTIAPAILTTAHQVEGLVGATAVAAGQDFSLVLQDDGSLLSFGGNDRGQLGDGSTTGRAVPGPVQGVGTVTAVRATGDSKSVLALASDGRLFAWGANDHGQIGDGTRNDALAPRPVVSEGSPVDFDVGEHALVVLGDGSVLAWGSGDRGQLGLGSTDDVLRPRTVPGIANAVQVAVGGGYSLVLTEDGTVLGFGDNSNGLMGPGVTDAEVTRPVPIQGLSGIVAIAAGRATGVALDVDGRVYTWGAGGFGQLGDGTNPTLRATPSEVPGLSGVVGISAGGPTVLVGRSDGTFLAFGFGGFGQIGDGFTASRAWPVPVRGIP